MDEEMEKDVDKAIKSRPEFDLTTEEGKRAYIEDSKQRAKESYEREKQKELRHELNKQARKELIKELGITEEEYDNVMDWDRPVSYVKNYPKLDENGVRNIIERIQKAQNTQNNIIQSMLSKSSQKDLVERNLRGPMIDDYQNLEKMKLSLLDTLSGFYLENDYCLNVVNTRGKMFSKDIE